MQAINDAVASTKQRVHHTQGSLVGTALTATLKVPRQGFEQWIAMVRRNSEEMAPLTRPAPARVVAEVRQYVTDLATIHKDSVRQLRVAWQPAYAAAAARLEKRSAGQERTEESQDQSGLAQSDASQGVVGPEGAVDVKPVAEVEPAPAIKPAVEHAPAEKQPAKVRTTAAKKSAAKPIKS